RTVLGEKQTEPVVRLVGQIRRVTGVHARTAIVGKPNASEPGRCHDASAGRVGVAAAFGGAVGLADEYDWLGRDGGGRRREAEKKSTDGYERYQSDKRAKRKFHDVSSLIVR